VLRRGPRRLGAARHGDIYAYGSLPGVPDCLYVDQAVRGAVPDPGAPQGAKGPPAARFEAPVGETVVTKNLQVLSLGAGVQSTVLLLMSAEGMLPKLDLAVFADTQAEPQYVYDHLDRLDEQVAKPAGITIKRVSDGSLEDLARNERMDVPMYLRHPDGTAGFLRRRQCTSNYKVRPIKRFCRKWMQDRGEKTYDQWIGISLDEFTRAKDADVKYIHHKFPLLDKRMDRRDCLKFLGERGWTTPKSACVFCPYRRDEEWRWLKEQHPTEFQRAVDFDTHIRAHRLDHLTADPYVHKSLKPLGEVVFGWTRKDTENAQLNFDGLSCSPFACAADGEPS